MPLFRPEAMRSQDRLHGEVSLVPPVTSQAMGLFLFGSVAVSALFLSLATYSKTTTVQGEMQSDLGIIRAIPARAGMIEEVLVKEGQHVRKGEALARVSVTTVAGDTSLEERRLEALDRRSKALMGRTPAFVADMQARMASLQAQISGGEAELASLSDQIVQQQDMVSRAESDLEKVQSVAKRGFISGNDLRVREDLASQRRQDLARLRQDQATRRSQIATARADMARARSDLDLQMRSIEGDRAEIDREAAESDNARTFVVTAGTSGTVTGITGHRGDPAVMGQPIMSVIPHGGHLQAVLNVPTAASGFVERGQTVRVSVDAYPYQTYGTIKGRISSVTDAAIPVVGSDGKSQDVFLVRADLSKSSMDAYGQKRFLRPGMTVSARITTRRRSLIGLLFDPLYAVAAR